MTDFAYWQQIFVNDGKFYCADCMEVFDLSQAMVDDQGQKWDVCLGCHDREVRRKNLPKDGTFGKETPFDG